MLGVSRSQVTRWLHGAGIDPLNAEKVDLLELVWSNLLRLYEPEAARAVAFRRQPAARRPSSHRSHPGGPGRGADAGDPRRARGLVRVILYRCFAWNERARRRRARQRRSGFRASSRATVGTTTPIVYGCLYLADREVSGVVEQLARFRGQRLTARCCAAAACRLRSPHSSSPTTPNSSTSTTRPCCGADRLRPSASRRATARSRSRRRYAATADTGAAGIRWWSIHESLWTNVHALRPQRPGAVGHGDQTAGARRSGGRRSRGVPRTSARFLRAPNAASS